MTNQEAYSRAKKALWRACRDTDFFEHGGLASGAILEAVTDALKEEFRLTPRTVWPTIDEADDNPDAWRMR